MHQLSAQALQRPESPIQNKGCMAISLHGQKLSDFLAPIYSITPSTIDNFSKWSHLVPMKYSIFNSVSKSNNVLSDLRVMMAQNIIYTLV